MFESSGFNENDILNIKASLRVNVDDCRKLGLDSLADDYQKTLDKLNNIDIRTFPLYR